MRETQTEENYLKAIYKLSLTDKSKISLTLIAEKMQINTASVIDMVKKLVAKNFIVYDKKNGVILCESGEKSALQIIRKHRLWEVFLYEKLKYTWDEIHDMAEQLEHIYHTDLADRLDAFLDFPKYDPHGDPIPTSTGKITVVKRILLKNLNKNETCQVVAVKDSSSVFLQYLGKISLAIGSKILVLDIFPFDGSMLIKIDDENEITISEKLSENIFISK